MIKNSPWRTIQPLGLDIDYYTEDEYFSSVKRAFPLFSRVWTEAMEEQYRHEIMNTPEGKIMEKMSETISKAIRDTLYSYVHEDSKITVPTFNFYALSKGISSISDEWMTEEQKSQIINHVEKRENPWTRESIELFHQNVPHAKIVEIPNGHHYCFIAQEELIYDEMKKFLFE